MELSRRQILATGLSTLLPLPTLAGTPNLKLSARPAEVQLAPTGYSKTKVWGFDGAIPGREIRIRQGDMLDLDFENDLPQASSIHWHGLRIENAMDGNKKDPQPVLRVPSDEQATELASLTRTSRLPKHVAMAPCRQSTRPSLAICLLRNRRNRIGRSTEAGPFF